jgi:hypothetical protein
MPPNPYGAPGYGPPNMMGGPQMHGGGFGAMGGSSGKRMSFPVRYYILSLANLGSYRSGWCRSLPCWRLEVR